MERRLTDAVGEWREVLGRQVPQARQIVNKLLSEKITFSPENHDGSPENHDGRRGFRFRATGTMEKLVEGIVPGSLRAVVSLKQPLSNPLIVQLTAFESLRTAVG